MMPDLKDFTAATAVSALFFDVAVDGMARRRCDALCFCAFQKLF
jgi:hypothetical protein